MKWTHGMRARLRLLFRSAAEERMDEEMRFHLEMETDRYIREGLSPADARRAAALAFGGVEGHKEAMRDGRTLAWVGGMSLDLRLAWRILVKHRWLSVVGGLGIALAVTIGTLFYGVRDAVLDSTLPFDEGERIVALELRDTEANEPERRILYELALWRRELRSVEELGAWRASRSNRNLIIPGGAAGPVSAAEMTASSFEATRVPALLGRTLVQEDELAGAPAVAVIGYELWRTRFGSDPGVVGREIHLGNSVHTVVGVMPEGFGFPVDDELWTPLRVGAAAPAPRTGRAIRVFGRLAPGATMESARAELATLDARMAAAYPETHQRLRTRLVPYTHQSLSRAVTVGFRAVQTLTLLLLVVVCVNIAVLVHARTAVRQGEIAVRSALGATRSRIVGQLFAEAFVLSLGAALVGVAIAGVVLAWANVVIREEGGLGFWADLRLSPGAVLYAVALATFSALIVGVIPALKATGSRLRPGLDQGSGGAGLRLGWGWTAQIIGQVAIATAILPVTSFSAWNHFRYGFDRAEFAAERFLTAQVGMEAQSDAGEESGAGEGDRAARFEDRVDELVARLEADPAVAAVTFARYPVGGTVPATLEIDGLPRDADALGAPSVRTNELHVGFLDVFGVPVLEGRGFRESDLAAGASAVVVNHAFVDEVLGGRNAVDRQFRYTWRWGPDWPPAGADSLRLYEIVGVVGDQLVVGTDPGEVEARVYHPATAGSLGGVSLAIRMRAGAPADHASRLREIAASVDPTLRIADILPLDEQLRREQRVYRFMGGAIAAVTLSVILLSAAGVHALMSLTVARRRREIGIRAALGARPARLLAGVFSRAAGQVAIGLALGVGAAMLINDAVENLTGGRAVLFISAAAVLMAVVGLLSALGPARRGLRIHPMEALRAE